MHASDTYTFCIDYNSRSVEKPARDLAKKMQNILPSFSINVAYRSKKLSNLLSCSLKEFISPFEHTNVIYKWRCPCRESSYIGMSVWKLIERIRDHQQASQQTAIYLHFSTFIEYKKPSRYTVKRQAKRMQILVKSPLVTSNLSSSSLKVISLFWRKTFARTLKEEKQRRIS